MMTGTCHHAFSIEIESPELFALAGLQPWSSQVAVVADLSHYAQLLLIFFLFLYQSEGYFFFLLLLSGTIR
jgi:hypothetical protein